MRLRSRLLIIIGLAWLLFMSVVYLGSNFYLLKNIKVKESQELNENILRVDKAISLYLSNLGTFTSDWGYWNDAYDYIDGINPKFIRENINLLVLANSHINLLLYINKQGRILIGMTTDAANKAFTPYPKSLEKYVFPGSLLLQHKEAIKNIRGLVYVDNRIILIASSAVSNTNQTKPINGTIITGRYFTKNLLSDIESDTGLELSLYTLDDFTHNLRINRIASLAADEGKQAYLQLENNKIANGYLILRDINQKIIGIIQVTMPRNTYISGLKAINYYLIMLCISGLLLCYLIWYLLKAYILDRVEKLTEKIQDIDSKKDYAARLSVLTKDELSSLSEHFNKMMETIQKSNRQTEYHIAQMKDSQNRLENMNKRLINEVNERKQAEAKAKMLSDDLLASRRDKKS